MRSLAVKISVAFLVVSLVGTSLMLVFVRQVTEREFSRFVQGEELNDFVTLVTLYYEDTGGWQGVGRYVNEQYARQARRGNNGGRGSNNPPPPFANRFLLVDGEQIVRVPAGGYLPEMPLPPDGPTNGKNIQIGTEIVGVVYEVDGPPPRNDDEEQYILRTNLALRNATVGATVTALVLGLLLARGLMRPLRELTTATRALTRGEWQSVPVRSQDELGELTTAFNQMSEELARANQLRRQMTADIAHDLRTPLTVLSGYVESLRDGVLQPTPARFEVMYDEVRHLTHLVEDLRTLSLVDAGELSLNRQSTRPQAILERTVQAFEHPAGQQDVGLSMTAPDDLPLVSVDGERMVQVLGNLVSNALRFTPAGGQIALSARQEKQHILFTVQDSGAGIPPEKLPHIFERFFRGDSSRAQQSDESGLGLAIARSLVEAHQGTISAQSELGQGTAFLIRLPIFEPFSD